MAIYFVSSADGDNGDSGATLDLAWATVEYALESGGLSAGDSVAVRRTHSEIPTSDIEPAYDGTPSSMINVFGLPRDAHAISSSDWTNGSTSVNVDDNDMDREQHQGRYITAPDGETYLITRISDSATIILDREYAGSTVSNSAAASIQADDSEADWDNYDDSGDTIKKTAWEADADDMPVIDFNDGSYQLQVSTDQFHIFKNIEFKDSADAAGIVYVRAANGSTIFQGCLFKQTANNSRIIQFEKDYVLFKRCIIEGSGSGTSQQGIYGGEGGLIELKDVAIYNCGDYGVQLLGPSIIINNVNIGVEQANGDGDIHSQRGGIIKGIDVKLGGSNGYVTFDDENPYQKVSIENYGKVLGEHRTFYCGGYYEKAAVSGETPNQKVSANVLKLTPNVNIEFIEALAVPVLEHIIDADTSSKSYRYWIYNDSGVTLNDTTAKDDIWLKVEYVSSYDDTSEYTIATEYSDEIDILDAADADDWDYIEVTGIQPAVASKVRLTVYYNKYLAATNVFVDPAVVIS